MLLHTAQGVTNLFLAQASSPGLASLWPAVLLLLIVAAQTPLGRGSRAVLLHR